MTMSLLCYCCSSQGRREQEQSRHILHIYVGSHECHQIELVPMSSVERNSFASIRLLTLVTVFNNQLLWTQLGVIMPALASVLEGPAPEWQRWANNYKMLNRMIKDVARSIQRDIVIKKDDIDQDKVDRLLVTTRYLASLQEIDVNGWHSLNQLLHFFKGHSEKLWKKMEHPYGSEDDSDDEDPAWIKLNGQCIEAAALVVEARLAQREACAISIDM